MLLKNPTTAGWTKEWGARTYADDINVRHVIDSNTVAGCGGRVWVANLEDTPFPSLLRIYRNTESFE